MNSTSSSKGGVSTKVAQKTETVFMTGLKKETDPPSVINQRSRESLNNKSNESLHKSRTGESLTEKSAGKGGAEDPLLKVEKLKILDNNDLVQS